MGTVGRQNMSLSAAETVSAVGRALLRRVIERGHQDMQTDRIRERLVVADADTCDVATGLWAAGEMARDRGVVTTLWRRGHDYHVELGDPLCDQVGGWELLAVMFP
jgi:hypothetical protein